jgi:quercetin dioxygenase-like cupin family protein
MPCIGGSSLNQGIREMPKKNFFPEIVTKLPEADIPIEGVQSHLFQGKNQQFVFMSFEKDAEAPEHSHEGQWAVVLDGEIELTINGKKFIFKKGDTYYIPRGVKHSASIRKGYKDLTLFDQKDRYKVK